jgi:hypothetical protein
MRGAYSVLVEKCEGKRTLARPSRKGNYNIKIYLEEIGWSGLDGIHQAQDKAKWWVGYCAGSNEHSGPIKFR